ncbi:unnamed protein product [Vicia faba]|uniref:Nuclear pore protein n=1 Tax=Vicia faba TaxID=3906 RepID=A0AAV0YR30_VICFA|nr:unnamed protein product [Vicia faba]
MSSPMGALMFPMIQNLETTLKAGGVPQMPQFRPSTVTSASNFASVNTQKSSTGLNSSTENKVINKEVKGKEEVKKTENAVQLESILSIHKLSRLGNHIDALREVTKLPFSPLDPREPDTSVEVFENLSPHVQACIPDLLKVALTCLDNVADSDGSLRLAADQIYAVELIGGATRVPKLQAKLQEFLGRKELDRHLDTDEAIVIAAATVDAAIARWTAHGLHPLCTLLPTIYFYPSTC